MILIIYCIKVLEYFNFFLPTFCQPFSNFLPTFFQLFANFFFANFLPTFLPTCRLVNIVPSVCNDFGENLGCYWVRNGRVFYIIIQLALIFEVEVDA